MIGRVRILLLLPAVVLGVGIAAAAPPESSKPETPRPEASATVLIAQVSLPGQPPSTSGTLVAPPTATGGGPFSYPEDGSVLRVGASSASATAQPGLSSSAQAVANVLAVSVFGGDVTADSVDVRAGAAAGPASAAADLGTPTIEGLTALGSPVTAAANLQVALGDWGTLDVLSSSTTTTEAPNGAESAVTGLRIKLVAEHGGLPPGSEIVVGSATARAVAQQPSEPIPTETVPTKPSPTTPTAQVPARPRPPDTPQEPGRSRPGGAPPELVRPAPEVTATLSQEGYVFPVFGTASFGDTFGAPRADVSGGWHHGEDIVAPMGTPLLAVADGTLFNVGWNDIGGWRVWLRDREGNEFYYAHLSAYSTLAREGARVEAGAVIGFLGKTGDAEASIPHLHFEIHPAALVYLGYDGAIAPYPYLVAWRRAEDVSFDAGRRYLPGDGSGLPIASARAGAVLLDVKDISASSGLVPGALERTMSAPPDRDPQGGSRSKGVPVVSGAGP